MGGNALIIGNSDGIGLAITRALLKSRWNIFGISRSASPINDSSYSHIVADVRDDQYPVELRSILKKNGPIDVCIYCAGTGKILDLYSMEGEVDIFDVNLTGMVKTAACVIPAMADRGKGHFIGLSSIVDEMLSPEAPSYHASKAAYSNYLEGLALALRPLGVSVSNVRFGFVDTKMAKDDVKPFMITVDRAARHLQKCIKKKPFRYTAPWIAIPLWKLRACVMKLRIITKSFFSR